MVRRHHLAPDKPLLAGIRAESSAVCAPVPGIAIIVGSLRPGGRSDADMITLDCFPPNETLLTGVVAKWHIGDVDAEASAARVFRATVPILRRDLVKPV